MDEKLREYVETVECEPPEKAIYLELARLDMCFGAAWKIVECEGSLEAIDRCLEIIDRRIALLGLNYEDRMKDNLTEGADK